MQAASVAGPPLAKGQAIGIGQTRLWVGRTGCPLAWSRSKLSCLEATPQASGRCPGRPSSASCRRSASAGTCRPFAPPPHDSRRALGPRRSRRQTWPLLFKTPQTHALAADADGSDRRKTHMEASTGAREWGDHPEVRDRNLGGH